MTRNSFASILSRKFYAQKFRGFELFCKHIFTGTKVARFYSWKYAKVFIIFKQTDVIQMIAFPISIKETQKYKIDMGYLFSPLFLNCHKMVNGKLMTTYSRCRITRHKRK